MKEAIEHYEAALKEAFPRGASGDVFHHWNEARKALEQPAQDVDWEKLYRLEVKKKEALAAKYERDTGKKLTHIVPMQQPAQDEPVAWINWCAATGKRSVSFECESELASEPLYAGITQNTQGHYSNDVSKAQSIAMDVIVVNLVREGINKHRARELAEHFVKRCNYTSGYCTGRTDLLAEQKEQQEPAAYFFTGIKVDGGTHGPHLIWKPEYMDSLSEKMGAVATPLYTHPQAREPVALNREYAQRLIEALHENGDPVSVDAAEEFERLLTSPQAREPLTDEEIDQLLPEIVNGGTFTVITYGRAVARAIEAAHGIGEKNLDVPKN